MSDPGQEVEQAEINGLIADIRAEKRRAEAAELIGPPKTATDMDRRRHRGLRGR